MRSLSLAVLALAVSGAVTSSVARAQAAAWPNKPVRILIAFPPGSAIDIVARIMGPRLSESIGQPVLVENRPGAGGLLGTELAAKAAPDGHTVFFGTLGNLSVNPLSYRLSYGHDARRRRRPLCRDGGRRRHGVGE